MHLCTTFLRSLVGATLAVAFGAASAQTPMPAGEVLTFESVTPRGHFELAARGFPPAPVTIPGRLFLPPAAPGRRVPAVVVHHGSGGVAPHHTERWARAFVAAGYAAYVIDSFTPRRVRDVSDNQDQLSQAADAADAFGALRALAAHPAIDPARIAHVGFSRGGYTSITTTVEAFRTAVVGEAGPRYKVAVAHYPGCHYNFFTARPSRTPLRIFIGDKDDYTAAAQCALYTDFMRQRGEDVVLQVYPDNGHAYDWDVPVQRVGTLQHFARCQPLMVQLDETPASPRRLPDGSRLVPEGTPMQQVVPAIFRWRDACQGRGASYGHAPGADLRERAVADTLAVLKTQFAD
jgi:dienelactone hydrolase